MKVRLTQQDKQQAIVEVPSSKSYSHRALIVASLASGVSTVRHVAENDDIQATIGALEKLGAKITPIENGYQVTGIAGKFPKESFTVDCHESGSTLRFIIPLCSAGGSKVTFVGKGKLLERPLDVYQKIFADQNCSFSWNEKECVVEGVLQPGNYTLPGNISSQFISGLLFYLPMLAHDSTIHIVEPYESKSYVHLTGDVLNSAGIEIVDDGNTIHIPGNQAYLPIDWNIEGDNSQAAFFACLSCMRKMPMTLKGVNLASSQGDTVIFSFLKEMGATVESTKDGVTVTCENLHPISMDLSDCPDLGPVLFALAATIPGTTTFTNIARLRLKESDRVACMQEELGKLGVDVLASENTVSIIGKSSLPGGVTFSGHNDHRIVMACSILAGMTDSAVEMDGCEAVNKSYPQFFQDLEKTGVKVENV